MEHSGRGRNANSFALFVSVVCLGLCSFRVPAHAVEGPATVPLDGGPLGMLEFPLVPMDIFTRRAERPVIRIIVSLATRPLGRTPPLG
jgi:hypothetical protein